MKHGLGVPDVGSLVASDTAPVRGGENGLLVDFFDTGALAVRICEALARPADFAGPRANARQTAVARYAASTLAPRRARLLDAVADGLVGRAGRRLAVGDGAFRQCCAGGV